MMNLTLELFVFSRGNGKLGQNTWFHPCSRNGWQWAAVAGVLEEVDTSDS